MSDALEHATNQDATGRAVLLRQERLSAQEDLQRLARAQEIVRAKVVSPLKPEGPRSSRQWCMDGPLGTPTAAFSSRDVAASAVASPKCLRRRCLQARLAARRMTLTTGVGSPSTRWLRCRSHGHIAAVDGAAATRRLHAVHARG